MATAAADEPRDAMEQVDGEERAETQAEIEEAEVEEAENQMEAEEVEIQVDVEEAENQMEVEEAEAEAEAEEEALQPALPVGRVKKIIRVDRDIRKVSSEAYMLVTAATELFLGSLAAGAHTAAAQRGRRVVRAVDVRAAARAHRPTADFLLDCLPAAAEAPPPRAAAASDGGGGGVTGPKPLPRGARRIDAFFQKVT